MKNTTFARLIIGLWVALVFFSITATIGVTYIVYHFIMKYW